MSARQRKIEPMPLEMARRVAGRVAGWLLPFAAGPEWWQWCGSLRRGRPYCGDLDLVVVPKRAPVAQGELGIGAATAGEERNLMWEEVVRYAEASGGRVVIESGAGKPGELMRVVSEPRAVDGWQHAVQLDVWFATPRTWASLLVCKTGSKEHNIWLAARFQGRTPPLHWRPNEGLFRCWSAPRPQFVEARTEEALYRLAGLAWIRPEYREQDWLARFEAGEIARQEEWH